LYIYELDSKASDSSITVDGRLMAGGVDTE
jgi:hypothetical protein